MSRVIPTSTGQVLSFEGPQLKAAVGPGSPRSSTERARAVKLSLDNERLTLTVNNPDSGSATEEIIVSYDGPPIEIGFNAKYLLDIMDQLTGPRSAALSDRCTITDRRARRSRRRRAVRADADARLRINRGMKLSTMAVREPGFGTSCAVAMEQSMLHLKRLRVSEFRSVASADLALGTGAIVLIGPNGAGKNQHPRSNLVSRSWSRHAAIEAFGCHAPWQQLGISLGGLCRRCERREHVAHRHGFVKRLARPRSPAIPS